MSDSLDEMTRKTQAYAETILFTAEDSGVPLGQEVTAAAVAALMILHERVIVEPEQFLRIVQCFAESIVEEGAHPLERAEAEGRRRGGVWSSLLRDMEGF